MDLALRRRLVSMPRDQLVILGFLGTVLGAVIVVPFGTLFLYSFMPDFPVDRYALTLVHYEGLYNNLDLMIDVTRNTLIYALFSAVIAITLGLVASVAIVKYFEDTKFQVFVFMPYTIPSVAAVTAWILLLGRQGMVNLLLMRAFGLDSPPIDIYSLGGMIWVEGLLTVPLAFLFLAPAIRSIPAAIDEASFITGASRAQTLRRIVIPLVWPSVVSAFVYLFIRNMATVATPSVLGVRKSIFTFGSVIPMYFIRGGEPNFSMAMAFSVILTLISGVFVLYYMRVQAQEGKFATVSGAGGFNPQSYATSRTRKALLGAFLVGYAFVAGILPFFAIFWDSVISPEYLILTLDVNALTLANFEAILSGNAGGVLAPVRSIYNTVFIALFTATFVMVTAMLISYANQGVNISFGWALSLVAALTLGVPAIVKSLAFLVTFITTPAYSTIWILVIAFMGSTLPVGMRYASPAMTKIGSEVLEASTISGSPEIRTFRKITLPLVSNEFASGWVHMYSYVVRVLPIPLLLYSTGSEMISVEIFNVLQSGYTKPASILSLVAILLILAPFAVFTLSGLFTTERSGL